MRPMRLAICCGSADVTDVGLRHCNVAAAVEETGKEAHGDEQRRRSRTREKHGVPNQPNHEHWTATDAIRERTPQRRGEKLRSG